MKTVKIFLDINSWKEWKKREKFSTFATLKGMLGRNIEHFLKKPV